MGGHFIWWAHMHTESRRMQIRMYYLNRMDAFSNPSGAPMNQISLRLLFSNFHNYWVHVVPLLVYSMITDDFRTNSPMHNRVNNVINIVPAIVQSLTHGVLLTERVQRLLQRTYPFENVRGKIVYCMNLLQFKKCNVIVIWHKFIVNDWAKQIRSHFSWGTQGSRQMVEKRQNVCRTLAAFRVFALLKRR